MCEVGCKYTSFMNSGSAIGITTVPMRFTEPWYLLLLPVAWGWVWWTGRRLLGVSRARRRRCANWRLGVSCVTEGGVLHT
jgi:hypothetical protein